MCCPIKVCMSKYAEILFGIDIAHKYDKIRQIVVLVINKIQLVIFCHS